VIRLVVLLLPRPKHAMLMQLDEHVLGWRFLGRRRSRVALGVTVLSGQPPGAFRVMAHSAHRGIVWMVFSGPSAHLVTRFMVGRIEIEFGHVELRWREGVQRTVGPFGSAAPALGLVMILGEMLTEFGQTMVTTGCST
jgi:hypothetical protein